MSNTNKLLDHILAKSHLKNDAALARFLELAPPIISKMRHGKLPVSDLTLVRIHEVTDMSIAELKELAGIAKFVRE